MLLKPNIKKKSVYNNRNPLLTKEREFNCDLGLTYIILMLYRYIPYCDRNR